MSPRTDGDSWDLQPCSPWLSLCSPGVCSVLRALSSHTTELLQLYVQFVMEVTLGIVAGQEGNCIHFPEK